MNSIRQANPTKDLKQCFRHCTTTYGISFKGTASGNLVHISMLVSIYAHLKVDLLVLRYPHTSQKMESRLMVTFPLVLWQLFLWKHFSGTDHMMQRSVLHTHVCLASRISAVTIPLLPISIDIDRYFQKYCDIDIDIHSQ